MGGSRGDELDFSDFVGCMQLAKVREVCNGRTFGDGLLLLFSNLAH